MSRTCYIVGGHAAHIDRQITPFLERCGIRVAGQLDYKAASHPQHMPRTDGVLLMADMVSHKVSDWATVEARRQNIKIVIGISKKAVLRQRLQDAGWMPAPASATAPPAPAQSAPAPEPAPAAPSPPAAPPEPALSVPAPAAETPPSTGREFIRQLVRQHPDWTSGQTRAAYRQRFGSDPSGGTIADARRCAGLAIQRKAMHRSKTAPALLPTVTLVDAERRYGMLVDDVTVEARVSDQETRMTVGETPLVFRTADMAIIIAALGAVLNQERGR